MKVAAVALAALALAAAGAAVASERFTDVDYIKASRCRGIAAGMHADTAAFDAFLKAESRTRVDLVMHRADEEAAHAKRQASDANLKDQLSAELSGACTAYLAGGTKAVAAQ